MATVVRLAELTGIRDSSAATDGDMCVELTDDPAVLGKMWGLVLLLALRDSATSVHYHPWRADGGLAYVIANVRYAMIPPPTELAGSVVAVARSLFTGSGRGGSGAACSSVELDVWGAAFVWDAVVWCSGERTGVELFRVAPPVPEPRHAEPAAADVTRDVNARHR
jgi:hypothetical protein